jgi:excisionase family DNA binding protein
MLHPAHDKLAYSIQELPAVTSLSRSRIYEMIKAGALPARKAQGRTLVLREDVEKFLKSLPTTAAYRAV